MGISVTDPRDSSASPPRKADSLGRKRGSPGTLHPTNAGSPVGQALRRVGLGARARSHSCPALEACVHGC
eukprot:5158503-Alexandrium_andersonii.AAC.1